MAKRRAKSPRKNKSIFKKFFTFPKVALYSLIALGIFTYVQVNSDQRILGIWDYSGSTVNTSEQGYPYSKYVSVRIWKDANANVKMDGENCLEKKFTFKLNGKTKTAQNSSCNYARFKVENDCNSVEFVKVNGSNEYSVTGVSYTDINNKNGKTVKGKKSVRVCGFPKWGEGFAYNEVSFGVKQK